VLARLRSAVCTFEPAVFHDGPESHALERAIRSALAESRIAPDAVGFVKANGLGTLEDDAREAAAIRATVGDTPVTAPKSLFGNLGAAAGIVETIAAVLAVEAGEIPPTRNYSQPDPNCPVRVVHTEPLPLPHPNGLVLGASGTGQTIAAVLEAA
jgi:3-oxoacyl-[acyl-carrier-protein] synthase II